VATPRVLLAITVYNGRAFVPRCIDSAMRLSQEGCSIDVLILDDCSPEPGWSEELRQFCVQRGAGYYRSPRNLGIVRNVNLGLLRALDSGYDHVIIANSDVIFPRDMVPDMLRVFQSNDGIGSVTAWSNNVSVYSLPNDDPDAHIADQGVVDWMNAALRREFGDEAVDVPAGISFCILIPITVLRRVGLMDTVFGRGYCEETDWTLRSQAMGFRIALSPSVFTYHAGRASTAGTGILPHGHTTVPAHEKIVAMRYPLFADQVGAFLGSDTLDTLWRRARGRLLREAAERWGYTVEASWLPRKQGDVPGVRVRVEPAGRTPLVEASWRGFRQPIVVDQEHPDVVAAIRAATGREPDEVRLQDPGALGELIAREFAGAGTPVSERVGYPARV
jgi:GT2 family glycosyltransferase